jgi:uncharacterized protein YcaQ
VEEEIGARGPLGSSHFEHTKRKAGGWWNWKPAAHALHYLWMSGRCAVHSRVNFERRLDVAEKVHGAAATAEPPGREEFWKWHARRSLHAMGAASQRDLRAYLSFPRLGLKERRGAMQTMLKSGEVVELALCDLEGRAHPGWYALAKDLPELRREARRARPRGTTLLSPFDSFLWHRERVKRLFGFDYKIEIYVPEGKRKYGYYSLPILHDGALVGRLDAKNHRQSKRLELRSVHFEPWFAEGDGSGGGPWDARVEREPALAGIAESLQSLMRFAGAERITLGRVAPHRLRGAVKSALRESASAS